MRCPFLISAVASFLFMPTAFSAVEVQKAGFEKSGKYLESGTVIGGYHQAPLSLQNVRESFDRQNNMERVVLDVAGVDGKSATQRPGFFHIAIQKQPARVVIDLENTLRSLVTAKELVKIFGKSRFFQKPVLITSRADKSVTLELSFRKSAKVEVFELSDPTKSGRIVLDVVESK